MTFGKHIGEKLPIYLLLAVLAVLTIFYGFVYIPGNEQKLNDAAVRILENKAISIKTKYEAYSNSINSGAVSYFAYWFFTLNKSDSVYYVDGRNSFHFSLAKDYLTRSCGDQKEMTRGDSSYLNLVDRNLIPHLDCFEENAGKRDIWKENDGTFHFVYSPAKMSYSSSRKGRPARTNQANVMCAEACCTRGDSVTRYFWLDIRGFMANLKSNDFFDDMFIVRDPFGKERYDATEFEINGYQSEVLDDSRLGLVRFGLIDTVSHTGSGIVNREIGGKSYKVYYKVVQLKRGLNVYLIGLVAADTFARQARQVAPWFFVFCTLGSLTLLLVLPLLKLFFFNQYNQLSASDAKLVVFSVILCVSLLVILIAGGYRVWGTEEKNIDRKLLALSEKIDCNVNTEIRRMLDVVRQDSLSDSTISRVQNQEMPKNIPFNEVFSLDDDGSVRNVFFDEPGLSIDIRKFPMKVDKRNYFIDMAALIKSGKEDDQSYVLESINSLTSGRSEVAVSIRYSNQYDSSIIRVITSPIPSLINTIFPAPYKFVVLDPDGIIKFNSEVDELKFENFVRECDDGEQLRAYLTKGVKGPVGFTYLRNDCYGYGRPLMKDWYLLVYYEVGTLRNFAAEIFILCLVTLALVTLYSGLLHEVLRSDIKRPYMLSMRPFVFDWLNPNKHGTHTWRGLALMNLALFGLEIVWLLADNSITLSLFFVFLVITIIYYVNYKKLTVTDASRKRRSRRILTTFGWIWSVLLLLGSIVEWNIVNVACLAGLIGVIAIAKIPNKRLEEVKQWLLSGKSVKYRPYSLYLCSWLLAIAIGPTLIFLGNHYAFKKLIYTYAYVLEDVINVQTALETEGKKDRGDYTRIDVRCGEAGLRNQGSGTFRNYLYELVPHYISYDREIAGLMFNFIPDYHRHQVLASDSYVGVAADSSFADNDMPGVFRGRPLKSGFSPPSPIQIYLGFLTVLTFVLFWWMMRAVPPRIFYMPDHDVWKYYGQKESTRGPDDVQSASQHENEGRSMIAGFPWEFKDDDEECHPLHEFEDKEDLLKSYSAKKNEAQSDEKKDFINEQFILELQEQAGARYRRLWRTCSEQEKLFLYDLAEDGVANQLNRSLIGTLSKKGLVRLLPKLEIVNYSFANFVKEEMEEEDLVALKEKSGARGRWKNIQIMLVIIIVATFGFLSVAEEGFLGRASAILASIALIVPNLVNIFGEFGKFFRSH